MTRHDLWLEVYFQLGWLAKFHLNHGNLSLCFLQLIFLTKRKTTHCSLSRSCKYIGANALRDKTSLLYFWFVLLTASISHVSVSRRKLELVSLLAFKITLAAQFCNFSSLRLNWLLKVGLRHYLFNSVVGWEIRGLICLRAPIAEDIFISSPQHD